MLDNQLLDLGIYSTMRKNNNTNNAINNHNNNISSRSSQFNINNDTSVDSLSKQAVRRRQLPQIPPVKKQLPAQPSQINQNKCNFLFFYFCSLIFCFH
jgi:hypothetical protein